MSTNKTIYKQSRTQTSELYWPETQAYEFFIQPNSAKQTFAELLTRVSS